jgi:hypothetical protein
MDVLFHDGVRVELIPTTTKKRSLLNFSLLHVCIYKASVFSGWRTA